MKKIITLSALAVILTGCSTGEEKKTKSVSELGFETSTQTKSSSEEKREEKVTETTTTVSSSSIKNSNSGISGVWVNSSAASSINQVTISEGSISVNGQTYKTEISSYEGNVKQVKVIDNAVAGGIGNFYYVPAGEKTPTSLIRSHKESTTSNDRLVWVSGASGATSEFIKR